MRGGGEIPPPIHFIMNTSEITKTSSTSFTEYLDRDGKVWYNESYYLQEDISQLTIKKHDETEHRTKT